MTTHLAVLIGRFQPFHRAHLALLEQALALAPRVVVVIGSAFQARTPRNPFTWTERAEMIRQALPEAQRGRVEFLPMRDYYDEARWLAAVRESVEAQTTTPAERASIALVGHVKDATSGYLRGFPGWTLVPAARRAGHDGTALRAAYFGAAEADSRAERDAALAALTDLVPPATLAFLRAWSALPFYAELAEEWRMLRDYRAAWAQAPYEPVFVTVDTVVRCAGKVLLIRRAKAPGRGLLAVPGGFIEPRETAYQSALRELAEETHLSLLPETMQDSLRGSAVFDHPDRSQRGRTITHAFYFDLGERELPELRADDDAAGADWVAIGELAGLEDRFLDDHFHMLDHFLGLTAGAAR